MKRVLLFSFIIIVIACNPDPDPDPDDNNKDPSIYLDTNGITIKCPDAYVGYKQVVNGKEYTVVDRQMIRDMFLNGEDLGLVCTSLVYYFEKLFVFNNMDDLIESGDILSNEDPLCPRVYSDPECSVIGNHGAIYGPSNIKTGEKTCYGTGGKSCFHSTFNDDISSWDTSSVANMAWLFFSLASFNQDISYWDTSNVQKMDFMFSGATMFNRDIGNWDVSSVTDMNNMFNLAFSFNQDIGNWDVSSVRNMAFMFNQAIYFNQDIGNWDVSNVNEMTAMFRAAVSFNQDLTKWCVENVDGYGFFTEKVFNMVPGLEDENTPVWGTCPTP